MDIFYVWQENGILRVNNPLHAKYQEFSVGTFVDISNNVPSWMSHFTKGVPAVVQYSSLQYKNDVERYENDVSFEEYVNAQGFNRKYKLLIRYSENKWSSSAWYIDSVLSPIQDKNRIAQYCNELSKLNH
ncbi:MAG: hypothetical protein IPP74_14250 [Alphaproteobacteria bacterium]|nr:hypothetical protein [Alphaproteobacteria bacterium]